MVGAALSRECIAHECAPTETTNHEEERPWKGNWKVVVTAEDGTLLATVPFTVE
jgi:hypothetical protein